MENYGSLGARIQIRRNGKKIDCVFFECCDSGCREAVFGFCMFSNGVRRHLLCPLFAPRFVSAFFFRARGGAAARLDGGLKEGGAVYAVSAPGLAAAAAFRETFLQDASGSLRTAGA